MAHVLAAALSTNADSVYIKILKSLRTKPAKDQRILIGSTVYTIKSYQQERKRSDTYDYYTVYLNQLAVSAALGASVTVL